MKYTYKVGDRVMWRGGWGTRAAEEAQIIDMGEKNDQPVYDLNNGHWAYEYQLNSLNDPINGEV